jgi:hypothetical protein
MTDTRAAFVAAYMDACKDKPADWNEIGYWYARQLWDAAINHERSECAKVCEMVPSAFGDNARCAAAIRARSEPS